MPSKPPYPGYNPNYRIVDFVGGLRRTCLVVELSSDGLDAAQLALIQERLEATLDKFLHSSPMIEHYQVVLPDRFDRWLRSGLRIS